MYMTASLHYSFFEYEFIFNYYSYKTVDNESKTSLTRHMEKYIKHQDEKYNHFITHSYDNVFFICDIFYRMCHSENFPITFGIFLQFYQFVLSALMNLCVFFAPLFDIVYALTSPIASISLLVQLGESPEVQVVMDLIYTKLLHFREVHPSFVPFCVLMQCLDSSTLQ